jgi:hypothetical protein
MESPGPITERSDAAASIHLRAQIHVAASDGRYAQRISRHTCRGSILTRKDHLPDTRGEQGDAIDGLGVPQFGPLGNEEHGVAQQRPHRIARSSQIASTEIPKDTNEADS